MLRAVFIFTLCPKCSGKDWNRGRVLQWKPEPDPGSINNCLPRWLYVSFYYKGRCVYIIYVYEGLIYILFTLELVFQVYLGYVSEFVLISDVDPDPDPDSFGSVDPDPKV